MTKHLYAALRELSKAVALAETAEQQAALQAQYEALDSLRAQAEYRGGPWRSVASLDG